MAEYYNFDSNCNSYVKSNKENGKRYLYDPIKDSYVENISTTMKERFLHNKYGHYGFHNFDILLKEILRETFPEAEYRYIHIGDYTFDADIEITCNNIKIRYAPYAMFVLSDCVEDTIDEFLKLIKDSSEKTIN